MSNTISSKDGPCEETGSSRFAIDKLIDTHIFLFGRNTRENILGIDPVALYSSRSSLKASSKVSRRSFNFFCWFNSC